MYLSRAPRPLVIGLHGGGGSAKEWPAYTNNGFETLAEKESFILVYPNGIKGQWNDGREVQSFYSQKNNIDDAGFLAGLIDFLIQNYPVDKQKVFVTGASNGGMMAHVFAGKYANKIAAIAAVISTIPLNMKDKLKPEAPVSVLMMNGTKDPLVQWEGGVVKFGKKATGYVISTEETVQFWVKNNKCASSPTITDLPDKDPSDGTNVKQAIYSGGTSGTEVILCTVINGGHAWPAYQDKRGGLLKGLVDNVVGKKSRDIDACETIWEFFKSHPKK